MRREVSRLGLIGKLALLLAASGFSYFVVALTRVVTNSLRLAYVQIRLRHAVRHPWPLYGFIPETEGHSRIYTGYPTSLRFDGIWRE
ncbi:hypothetical protein [Shewanella marisflavi]|uniref:hypothetical protein n=1 Tax=Shewanella marisflavi TaxID=260364 RepID=UPI003AAD52C3